MPWLGGGDVVAMSQAFVDSFNTVTLRFCTVSTVFSNLKLSITCRVGLDLRVYIVNGSLV